MKFFVVIALLASACAEPEAEAWGTYGYTAGLAGLGYSRAYSTVLARPVTTYGIPALTGYGGYSTGIRGLWKREAEADSEAEAWGTYGYSGLAGLGYGAYGGAYTTAAIARPIATTAIVRPVAATRTITRPIGVRTYGYTTGLTGYGYDAGLRGLWKREAEAESDAEADSEAEAWGTYGYSGLAGLGYGAYGRAYTTAAIARPLATTAIVRPVAATRTITRPIGVRTYGYTTGLTGYRAGLRGLWKRDAEADSEAEAWNTYGYSGLAGLGYGAYGGAYTTAAIARPIATTAIVRPVAATRTITRPIGVRTYGYTTGLTGYSAGLRGLWKRDAESDPEAWYSNYGYGLTGLGGVYTTASIARPVYGYSGRYLW